MNANTNTSNLSSVWDKVKHFVYKDKMNFETAMYKLDAKKKLSIARDALEGKCYKSDDKEIKNLFNEWLRWVQSDDRGTIAWWHWIHQNQPDDDADGRNEPPIKDRDDYIIQLWHTINEPDGDNKEARERIEEGLTHWSYYQNHFFNWFLNRFDIVRAREVFAKGWLRRYVHIPVSLASIIVVSSYFIAGYHQGWEWITFALLIFSIFLIGWGITRFKIGHYFQSLTPRLAITTGIGYLFLLSANNLASLIYANSLPVIAQVFICLALIGSVWIYVIQIIQRRVKPMLRLGQAFKRSFHSMLLGAAYSAIGLFLTAPIMFHPLMLSDKVSTPESQVSLFIIAALALAFGIVLQLVWEDKPVTEPL